MPMSSPSFGLAERMAPLVQFGRGDGGRGAGLPAFAEDEPAQDEIRRSKSRGHPAGTSFARKYQR